MFAMNFKERPWQVVYSGGVKVFLLQSACKCELNISVL